MELGAPDVPHFADGGATGEELADRIRDWLALHRLAPFWVHYDPELTLAEILEMMGILNRNALYILYGNTGIGDHVVVCRGDKVIHNPMWAGSPLTGPGSHGFWTVLVICRT